MPPDARNPTVGTAGSGNKCSLLASSNTSEFSSSHNAKQVKTRGGRGSRQKGNREERLLVRYLQERGFGAQRIPLSGACGGRFGSDISLALLGVDRKIEVKVRQRGFETIYRWLADNDALIIRKNRESALVVVRLNFTAEIAVAAKKCKPNSQFFEVKGFEKTAAPRASRTADHGHMAELKHNKGI